MLNGLKLLTKVAVLSSLLLAGVTGTAHATPAVCKRLAGTTIFTDMLYGVAAGAIVSGLYMVTDENHDKFNQKLAWGALGGSAVGAGLGTAEVLFSRCQTDASNSSAKHVNFFATRSTDSKPSIMGLNLSLAI